MPFELPPPRRNVDVAVADFECLHPGLFGIAYRMLGNAADAEDVVHDVWVRWDGADRARVRSRVAFLVTITTRVALNLAGSARVRCEVGGRPPEGLLAGSVVPARAADLPEHAA